jgi:hypothetical protein
MGTISGFMPGRILVGTFIALFTTGESMQLWNRVMNTEINLIGRPVNE